MTQINKRKNKNYYRKPLVTLINELTKAKIPFYDSKKAEYFIEHYEDPSILDSDHNNYLKKQMEKDFKHYEEYIERYGCSTHILKGNPHCKECVKKLNKLAEDNNAIILTGKRNYMIKKTNGKRF